MPIDPKRCTAEEMLHALDEFFAAADIYERDKLWIVLSALRGPDSDDDVIKIRYTAPIRRAIFPQAWRCMIGMFISENPEISFEAEQKLHEMSPSMHHVLSGHYFHHIRSAEMVLKNMGRLTSRTGEGR